MPVTFQGIRATSGILVPQGGTGLSSIAAGEILVGNGSNPISTIPVGSEGQILTVVSGAWAAANNAGGGGGGLSTVNTSGNISGDGSAGTPVTLNSNISLNSVTASLSGDGSQITGLTASQISGLSDAVTNIPNASLQNSSITINGQAIALGGSITVADQSNMYFTGSGFAVGNVVALSGSLVKADYSDDTKSNAFGVVSAVAGTDVTVKVFGEVTALSASNYSTAGTLLYVGVSGSVTNYAGIPSGKYITQVGILSPNSGKLIIQPRIFGQKN